MAYQSLLGHIIILVAVLEGLLVLIDLEGGGGDGGEGDIQEPLLALFAWPPCLQANLLEACGDCCLGYYRQVTQIWWSEMM